jgi:hypothetical protein
MESSWSRHCDVPMEKIAGSTAEDGEALIAGSNRNKRRITSRKKDHQVLVICCPAGQQKHAEQKT